MLAVQNYENAFESLPAGVVNADGPVRSEPAGLHQSWIIQTLPYLEAPAAYRAIDFSKSVYDPANKQVRDLSLPELVCPSEPMYRRGTSNFAGCYHDVEAPIAADNQGVLFLNSHVRRRDISDGTAYTIFVGEKRIEPGDLGWMSGTRATLRNTGTQPNLFDPSPVGNTAAANTDQQHAAAAAPDPALQVGGFGSAHSYGAFFGFGDGSVRYTSEDIDPQLWQRLGNRADGQLVELPLDEE
jgi:hypothetical protein